MELSFAYVVIFKFVKMTRGFSRGYFKLLLEPERGFVVQIKKGEDPVRSKLFMKELFFAKSRPRLLPLLLLLLSI